MIKVTPQDLRTAADSIEASIKSIQQDVEAIDDAVRQVRGLKHLEGERAARLLTRYEQTYPVMEAWPNRLLGFAQMLRETAQRFEEADRKAQYGLTGNAPNTVSLEDIFRLLPGLLPPGFDWSEFIKDGAKGLKLDDFLQGLFIKHGPAGMINSYLLDHLAEVKPEWMRFLRNHGVAESIGTLVDVATAGNSREALLQLMGGSAKIGLSYLGKGTGVEALKQVFDGVTDFAISGETSDLIAGGLKGAVYLVPGGKEVMIANHAIQFAGKGAGLLVYAGADWLGAGDPVLADGFRAQSQQFMDAVGNMNLENGIDATAKGIDNILRGGDVGQNVGEVLKGWGAVGEGGINTAFEGGKMFWGVTGSVVGQALNIDTSDFVRTAQTMTWQDVGQTLEYAGNELGSAISDTAADVGNRIEQGGKDLGSFVSDGFKQLSAIF